jgi:K+-transporting ATPase KdpF subunit
LPEDRSLRNLNGIGGNVDALFTADVLGWIWQARTAATWEGGMTGMHVLAAVLSLGLLVYLGIALLQPERFQ